MWPSTISRRLLAMFLALALSLSCTMEVWAEESAIAATMQLAKTEGTVDISNSSGKSVSLIQNMRLRSGYETATQEDSYAWINLDRTKLVTEPMDEDESMNIRTSTMVVGIRGTCGWLKIIDQQTTEVYILEGTVEVRVTDPVTGQSKTDIVSGGEKVICQVYPQDTPSDKCDTMFTQDTTLYAHWTEIVSPPTITVTFDANGGSVPPVSAVTGADGKLSSLPTPTRNDYDFIGWFAESTGGTEVTADTVFTQNTTIYALWTEAVTASGTAGENVDWAYYGVSRTLRFAGSGEMDGPESMDTPELIDRP